jgi:carboxyl-terminal processing protease
MWFFAIAIFLQTLAAQASPATLEAFDRTWETARTQIYPGILSDRFTESTRLALRAKASATNSLEDLSDSVLNPFLLSLGVSHTKFYQNQDPDFFYLSALFDGQKVDAFPIWQIGVQVNKEAEGYRLREVLPGLPAARAGFLRGDLLLRCGKDPFHPFRCFEAGAPRRIHAERNGRRLARTVAPIYQSMPRSYVQAMENGKKIFPVLNSKRVGYLHLWVGGFEENLKRYHDGLESLRDTDAIILDLRGGFGGASLELVDFFYPDRSSYASMQGIRRDGSLTDSEAWEPANNPRPYNGLLVVLTNEGTRSGKEMMAFQLKKNRAILIGTNTAGMFVGGRFWKEKNAPYALYLAAQGALLDGENIEGRGVEPQIPVKYPMNRTRKVDPQLDAALAYLIGALSRPDSAPSH